MIWGVEIISAILPDAFNYFNELGVELVSCTSIVPATELDSLQFQTAINSDCWNSAAIKSSSENRSGFIGKILVALNPNFLLLIDATLFNLLLPKDFTT